MAGKKKEVSLQMAVTNQEQWDEMLAIKGLNVVDVYQQWCGPCRAVVSLFRKVKNELGDDLLHFATAEADTIDALEKYRGKCEPTFLFYGGGELVAFLRGANAPVLQKMVVEELAQEKKVLEQGAERRVVKDEGLKEEEEEAEVNGHQQSEEDVLVPASKSYTVAIIKPDAVAHGKANDIIMKVQEEGFEILAHEERILSEAEARDFYQHKAAEPYFEELVQFMSSGPCHVLLVSNQEGSDDVIPAWREFIGPANTEEAKRDKPESLRAQYGTEAVFNAVHGSEDQDQASRELAFFFPNFRTTSTLDQSGTEESRVERTLAIIRPDAAREKRDEILLRIEEAGFTVAMQKEVMLTEDMVRQFYSHHHQEKDYFPALLQHMTSGPVLALGLVRIGAVQRWREMLGPKNVTQAKEEEPESLRARFAVENDPINQIHGSGSVEEAEREIEFFFPPERTLAVIKPDALEEHKEEILEHVQKAGFTISCAKETIMSTEMAEEFYKEHREKPFFSQLVEFMTRGPCLLMALTKENAVEDWRAMMGPTDPSQAKEQAPDSLRARFATDILQNSVHGSSNSKHANEKIHFIFGSIQSEADVPWNGEETAPSKDPGPESSREDDVEEMKIISEKNEPESDSSAVEPNDKEPSGPLAEEDSGPAGGEDQSQPSSQHPQEEAEAALEQEAESAAETGSGIPPQEVASSSEHSKDPQNSQERASTHSRNSDTHSSGGEGKQSPDPNQSELRSTEIQGPGDQEADPETAPS